MNNIKDELRKMLKEVQSVPDQSGSIQVEWVKVRIRSILELFDPETVSDNGSFSDSKKWLRENRRQYAGKWVALRGGTLIDSDKSRKVLQSVISLRPDLAEILVVLVEGEQFLPGPPPEVPKEKRWKKWPCRPKETLNCAICDAPVLKYDKNCHNCGVLFKK